MRVVLLQELRGDLIKNVVDAFAETLVQVYELNGGNSANWKELVNIITVIDLSYLWWTPSMGMYGDMLMGNR